MRRYAVILLVLAATMVYAIVRYNVFGTVAPAQIPLFIANKALSFSALLLLTMAWATDLLYPPARPDLINRAWHPRRLSRAAAVFSMMHLGASVLMMNAGYYPKFYSEASRMTAAAELSMFLGLAMVAGMAWQARLWAEKSGPRRRNIALGVLLAGTLHAGLIGWNGWWQPSGWPGHLPPITLLSVVSVIAGLILRPCLARVRADDCMRES